MARGGWAFALLLLAWPVRAEVPSEILRPMPRPEAMVVPQAVPELRPRPRPAGFSAVVDPQPILTAQPDASIRRLSDVRPLRRPQPEQVAGISPQPQASPEPKAKPERRRKREKVSLKGSVCGEAAIKGEKIARITSKVSGCGIEEPVRVTSVSGVRLSQPATLDCSAAKALRTWVDTGLQPAYGRVKVVELRVAAHYICRSRNNIRGAKISEHGRGRAIDIAGVVLESGKTVMVAGGYGRELRSAHKAACGVFGTTLGPGSDGFHEDHLHFDTATHRNGPYCR